MFDSGEEKVLKAYPKVLDRYKKELGESISEANSNSNDNNESLGAEREKAVVRVRTMDSSPVVRESNSRDYNFDNTPNYYGPSSDFNGYEFTSQKGTSFVLVIVALLTLVFLVAIVTVGILKFIGI